MRRKVRLTESELRRAIANVLNNTRKRTTRGVVNEVIGTLKGKRMLRESACIKGNEQAIADWLSQYLNEPRGYVYQAKQENIF